jgi:hypothetical protein
MFKEKAELTGKRFVDKIEVVSFGQVSGLTMRHSPLLKQSPLGNQ